VQEDVKHKLLAEILLDPLHMDPSFANVLTSDAWVRAAEELRGTTYGKLLVIAGSR